MTMTTAHSNAETKNTAPTAPARVSYRDCLAGKAKPPKDALGKMVFQVLMVGGMVTFMGIFNGIQHDGIGFLPHGLWMLPLIFCIAFSVRSFIANPIVNRIAPKFILGHLKGYRTGIAMTLLNVCVMCPIMSVIITMLLNGVDGYWSALLSSLPLSAVTAILANYFIVGPAVKMIWTNKLSRNGNVQVMHNIQKYVMPWTFILNN